MLIGVWPRCLTASSSEVAELEFVNVFSLQYALTGIVCCFLSKGDQDYVLFSLFIILTGFFFIVVVGVSAVVCMRFVHTLALQTG